MAFSFINHMSSLYHFCTAVTTKSYNRVWVYMWLLDPV